MTKRNKLYSLTRPHGIFDFSWLFFRDILRKYIGLDWRTEIFLERSLDAPVTEIVPKIKVQIEQATEDDLERFKDIVDEKKYHRFQERFKKDRICFMARDENRVVAFAWISVEDEFEPNSQVEVKLNEWEAYLFDDYVVPEYRNNKLQSALLSKRLMYLYIQGYHKVKALVGSNNIHPLKAYASAGFKPGRAKILFTIFGLSFHHWQEYVMESD